jgi:hypothetical protein
LEPLATGKEETIVEERGGHVRWWIRASSDDGGEVRV